MPANPSHSEVPAVVTVIIFSMPWNLNRHVRRVGLGLSAKIFSRNLKYSELVVGSSSCTSDSESESPVRLTVLSLSSSSLFKFAILLQCTFKLQFKFTMNFAWTQTVQQFKLNSPTSGRSSTLGSTAGATSSSRS